MNTERLNCIREAKKYQRMAIRALFPQEVAGHMETIENEFKDMFKDIMKDFVCDMMKGDSSDSGSNTMWEKEDISEKRDDNYSNTTDNRKVKSKGNVKKVHRVKKISIG